MLYLLDANVPITAHNTYYPLDRVPEFWEWLIHLGNSGKVKIAREIYEEIKHGDDELANWIKLDEVQQALLLVEEVEITHVRLILNEGYAPDLSDDEIEKVGRDPFLIAYAAANPNGNTIVTTEVSRRSKQRANRHVPDVCEHFGIPCCNTFELTNALDFSTKWNKGQ